MGFYIINQQSESDLPRSGSLHDWIEDEYPDLTQEQIKQHILNLCVVLQMDPDDLATWLGFENGQAD